MAFGISTVATLSTFIGLVVSISLGVISLAGVSISGMVTVLTKKHQKKLVKFAKLVDIVSLAIAVFETSLPKAVNNVEIEEREFQVR